MDFNGFVNLLGDKEKFVEKIKERLNHTAYTRVEDIKKEIANDFMKKEKSDGSSELEI